MYTNIHQLTAVNNNKSKTEVYQDMTNIIKKYNKLRQTYCIDNNINLNINFDTDLSNKSDLDIKHLLIELWIELALEYIKCNIFPCEIRTKNDYINSIVDFITFDSNKIRRIYVMTTFIIKIMSSCGQDDKICNLILNFINECFQILNEINISYETVKKSALFRYKKNIEELSNMYDYINNIQQSIYETDQQNNTLFINLKNKENKENKKNNLNSDFINLLDFTTSNYFNIHDRLKYHLDTQTKRNELTNKQNDLFTKSIEIICSEAYMLHEIDQISFITNFNVLLKDASERVNNYKDFIKDSYIKCALVINSDNSSDKDKLADVSFDKEKYFVNDDIESHRTSISSTLVINRDEDDYSGSEYAELVENESKNESIKKCCGIM